MAQKHQRSNREAKKPKQDKTKVVVSATSAASARANPVKTVVSAAKAR